MAAPVSPSQSLTFGEAMARFGRWVQSEPLQAALLAASFGTLVYFFGWAGLWVNASQSTARWAWTAWAGEQVHGRLILPISLVLAWLQKDKILAAVKKGSGAGIFYLVVGVLFFVVGARCLQPRLALISLPFLLYGATLYLWGKAVARLILFPVVFLVFMIPVAAMEQATFQLQFVITNTIALLSKLIGISIQAVGTTLTARDGSFDFEIAEGCSGVRSLAAMSMLTAVYVHLTQDTLWKKVVIFGASLMFAIVGNVGRLFTIILVARFINPHFAGDIYHDYSGFLFFPVGVLAMTGFARLVNLDWKQYFIPAPAATGSKPAIASASSEDAAQPKASPISYDY